MSTIALHPRSIACTAGELPAELARRGIRPDQRVTVLIEPQDWLEDARAAARASLAVDGLSDADVDALIRDARNEVAMAPP